MPPEPADDLGPARTFWTGALAGFTEPTPLGIARPAGRAGGAPGRTGHPLPRALSDRLDRFAREHRLTLGTLLTGAWAVVLGWYAGVDDVLFGTALPGAREALPARVRLDWDRPVCEWLAQLQKERARALRYGFPPLDRVQAWSEVPAGRRLFDSVLVVEDDQDGEAASLPHTDHPLVLRASGHHRPLVLEARFDRGLLDSRLVRRLLGHLANVLEGFLAGPVLGEVELIGPAERADLVGRGAARASFPIEPADLVPARFAAWAERDPDRVAVSFGDHRVSYRELLPRVARLAHRLRGAGVGPGVLVGVCLPRGVDLVVAVLAVACAGGGYVPVDRRDPAARVRTILGDASVAVLLTGREVADQLAARGAESWDAGPVGTPITVCLDDPGEQELLARLPEALPALSAAADDVAYVIYTSGSTSRCGSCGGRWPTAAGWWSCPTSSPATRPGSGSCCWPRV
jgi:non-ribosomal peptide synthetase component F